MSPPVLAANVCTAHGKTHRILLPHLSTALTILDHRTSLRRVRRLQLTAGHQTPSRATHHPNLIPAVQIKANGPD